MAKKQRSAADIMSRVMVTTTPDVLLTDVIELILRYNVSCLPVVDDTYALLGIVSEYDVMNFAFSGEADRTTVGESMSRNIVTVAPADDLETVINLCLSRRMHRIPVVEGQTLVGIISRRDILREALDMYREQ